MAFRKQNFSSLSETFQSRAELIGPSLASLSTLRLRGVIRHGGRCGAASLGHCAASVGATVLGFASVCLA